MPTSFKRDGFHSVTPYLMASNLDALLEFIQNTFGGVIFSKISRSDGTTMHVEMQIGDSMIMLGESNKDFDAYTSALYLYVEDCDATYDLALTHGGQSVMPVTTMDHAGERYGGVLDPAGNVWWIATHLHEVPRAEAERIIKERGI